MPQNTVQEPQGVPFYDTKSGDTHYLKTEPQIQAYINSSDMGINASRDQDMGWRLGAEWVKKIKRFKRDQNQMSILAARNGGQRVTTVQILYYLYGQQVAQYMEEMEDNENPFEEEYQRQLNGGGAADGAFNVDRKVPQALVDFEDDSPNEADITDLIDDVPEDEGEPAPATTLGATPEEVDAAAPAEETRKVNRDAGDGQFVSDEEAKANPGTTVTETVKNTKPKAKNK